MNQMVTGSFQLMKKINRTLILDIIRQHGPISRADIAKMTKLTPPTVTNIVRDLLNTGIIYEGDRMDSTGGRKAIEIQINPKAFYVIGVRIGGSKVSTVVIDLSGDIVSSAGNDLSNVKGDLVMDKVNKTIAKVIKQSKIDYNKFIGIGVGMHGLVHSETGTSIFAPNLAMRNVKVKDLIEKEFNIPVHLDNDVRAMALGESWFGNGQDVDNFIFIHVGTGIGAGIVFNQEVYRGVSESAGEIGHTTVVEDGPKCNCGNYGCLEVMAAGPAIVKRAIKEIKRGTISTLTERVKDLEDITAKTIYEEAQSGDELSINLIKETGKFLGIGIANLVNIFNPEKIILGGGVSEAGEMLFEPLIQTAMIRAMEVPAAKVKILPTKLGEHVGVLGAATLVLRNMFKITKVG